MDVNDILESYGALKSIITVPTRLYATLVVILTDIPSLFHPPTTLSPLQVDQDKLGKDSDHEIVVLAPVSNVQCKRERKKRVFTRPLPDSQIAKFVQELSSFPWDEVFMNKTVDEQVGMFHNFLRKNLDKYFPEKTTKMSTLYRNWFSPQLKQINRAMNREFYSHRKSKKYKKLKSKFKKNLRKAQSEHFIPDL